MNLLFFLGGEHSCFKSLTDSKLCCLGNVVFLMKWINWSILPLFQLESENKIYDTSDVKGAEPGKEQTCHYRSRKGKEEIIPLNLKQKCKF